MKVLVVGASGFIGSHLVRALTARGDEVVATSRNPTKLNGSVPAVHWDPNAGPLPAEALQGVDAVVNLAGEPVAPKLVGLLALSGRWNKTKKKKIRDSRVNATRNVVAAIAAAEQKPRVLVSASAIGYYGDGQHKVLHENTSRGRDFLADVCLAWEGEARKVRDHGVRLAIVRIGVVLGRDGGAYPIMSRPFRMFAGGPIGMGRRWFSWIHIDDMVGVLMHMIDHEEADGIFNGTAPNPVTSAEFSQTLASILKRPNLFFVPPPALYLTLGGFATVICASQRVLPNRTIGTGYNFKYPTVRPALEDLR